MRLVLLSDTHNLHASLGTLPEGDVVLHAGDISGNHDFLFERNPGVAEALVPANVTYLRDSGVEIEGLKIWGSPWQPWFGDWAFNLDRGRRLAEKWALIPEEVNVLFGHIHEAYGQYSAAGCTWVNASICDRQYLPGNAPVVVDL